MTIEKIAKELDDIFAIPRDGSNIESESQEAAYADAMQGNTTVAFEQKAAEVNATLSKIPSTITTEVEYASTPPIKPDIADVAPPKIEAPKEVKTEVQSISQAQPAKEVKHEPESKTTTLEGIIEGAISAKNSKPQPAEAVAPEQASDDEDGESTVHEEVEPEVRTKLDSVPASQAASTENAIGIENEDDWLLEPPSPKYSAFYEEKRKILPKILRGGKLPISKYGQELMRASIDTKVDLYDHLRIGDKMTEIRQWQTRIMEIRGEVLSQFHSWKRAVELFRGLLARSEYSKPAIAQEGTNYNHMRDMEMYFTDLQYLHEFSKEMLTTLEHQFDSLSRQVTLTMPQKGIERYEQSSLQSAQSIVVSAPPPVLKMPEKKHDLSGYDRLENNVEDKGFSPVKSNSNSKDKEPKIASGWGIVGKGSKS